MENELNFLNHAGTLATSRLGDLCERVVRKNTDNQSKLPLTISSIDGLVDQRDYFNKIVAAKDMSGYYLLKRGEFAYNKSYSVGYDYGSIKRLNRYDEGCLSTLYICFAIKSDLIDSDYLEWFFNSLFWYKEMPNICAEGARNHGLLNVDTDEFFNLSITYPVDIEEQKKIAKILNSLDAKIASEKIETEKLKNLKSSMLTKMFPKEGKKVPEIRFDGFTDDWEQRKLIELTSVFTDGDWIEAKDQSDSGIRLVQTGNVGTTEYLDKINNAKWISEDTFQTLKCKEIYEGDILISRLPEPAGRACIMPNLGTKMITAVDCTIVRTNENNDSKFLVQYLSTPSYFKIVNTFLGGGTRQRISRNNLAEIIVPTPCNIAEQAKIGAYFSQLDHLITLHQRKYEKLLDVKKAMLSKLIGGAS